MREFLCRVFLSHLQSHLRSKNWRKLFCGGSERLPGTKIDGVGPLLFVWAAQFSATKITEEVSNHHEIDIER